MAPAARAKAAGAASGIPDAAPAVLGAASREAARPTQGYWLPSSTSVPLVCVPVAHGRLAL